MATITINSILGGQSPTTHFAAKDQFRASLGIDPGQPIADSGINANVASGLIRPNGIFLNGSPTSPILWLLKSPKGNGNIYAYGAAGSAYSLTQSGASFTALSDGGSLSSSSGNGAAYYDNYLYFAKNTDVARYGPLDGAPIFDATYWTSTLSKTALSNTTYPSTTSFNPAPANYSNHVMHRHSDGKLYFADVVGNQGTIHIISTTKTTVEGDTDNGSKYSALTFGYGLWPTAIESYGSQLVIALYESSLQSGGFYSGRMYAAKLAFWDTISNSFNTISWDEFPDGIITALKNIDGILYIISGNPGYSGFRITRYVGGYSVSEIAFYELGQPPLAGAVDGDGTELLIGGQTSVPTSAPCVYSYGLKKSSLGKGLFTPIRATGNSSAVTSAVLQLGTNFSSRRTVVAWGAGDATTTNGVDFSNNVFGGSYGNANSYWWSQQYNIGQPFQIKRIRIPLAQAMAANMTVVPTLYFDNGNKTQALTTINNTNFPGLMVANIRTAGNGTNIIMGQNNFWLELAISGTVLCTVDLPIIIDFEIIPD